MVETVWAGSKERLLVLSVNYSNRNKEWGLLGKGSPERDTCVSSRHSQKCVTLLKLMTEFNINCSLLGPLFLYNFYLRTLNRHKSLIIRAFDLIPTLRTWPEYQLSAGIHSHKAGTKYPHESLLYLLWPRFLL